METAPLKSFATSARTELIREVTARITAVLSQGSPERVESPTAVDSLEKAVAVGGGGDRGKAHVADKVAYTWFNRIIALRFMDANGYTGIGVVSPAANHVGQPEVLAAAKRGQIDQEVVSNDRTTAAIAGLLNGTCQPRPGVDAQVEAYSLLLVAYCQFWHKAMPFMFERQGDLTELLIPANLLAGDSVLTRSVDVLSEDACKDVEVIGWLYQFYISERKDEVFAGFKKNKKAGADEIPAATQLFTPHWIVRYLVENSLGRLWMLNRPNSGLIHQMDYYIAPVEEEINFLKIAKPEELKVIDPACGSGHMLTYAFDLLYAIYAEEGHAPSDIPGLILTNNLYGTEIDPRAGALAAFALTMKAVAKRKLFLKNSLEPNICVLEPIVFSPDELDYLVTSDGDRLAEEAFWTQFADADAFGSLVKPDPALVLRLANHLEDLDDGGDMYRADAIARAHRGISQAEYLCPGYSVVVANPPYMDARNMSPALYDHLLAQFPAGSTGLDLAFALRAGNLLRPAGYIGLLNMDSWLGNVECAAFREVIREKLAPRIVLHLGPRAFPEIAGEVVQVSASLFQRVAAGNSRATFVAATAGSTVEAKIAQFHDEERRFTHRLEWFDVFPGKVFTPYAASERAHDAFATAATMNSIADVRTGLQTGDNVRFLRQWYEVSASQIRGADDFARWVPYVKSSSPTRWFAREDLVLDWLRDGAEIRAHRSSVVRNAQYYFRPGLSYGGLAGTLKARSVAPGAIFDQKNSMVFPVAPVTIGQLLALMNSHSFEHLARLISPKGFGVGTLAQLPIPTGALSAARIEEIANRAVELSTLLFDRSETSRGFSGLKSILLDDQVLGDLRLSAEAATKNEAEIHAEIRQLERENDEFFAGALLATQATDDARQDEPLRQTSASSLMADLVSFAVGCMFGRYSLDEPGLILANQDSSLQDYLARVPSPTYAPDADSVIPIVDGDWFEDDIAGSFRHFLRVAFGEQHFEANLNFVLESLGVKNLREYFITRTGRSRFYDDHVQRYKKRPIYWLFSSPKGSFNAMVYLHRYRPSTASTVLTYLREYVTKLESSLQQVERAGNAKEADRLRKILVELNEYEHDTLYPKASENVVIDLNDGVKVNYPKLGEALRKIAGLESSGD
ncbi:BREX-1 system adenine-specific DNA-methyltransferase PglX [Mycolicibacterium iranicum]|uniref:site-specific DNA-methyltransferase (adenine-specific) n=1 Tax=Mycolicibacterium iranicum TaxID=912594 RepID=A0A1X1WSH6_MYCIR|nr:BREX-1 system adenine-specific DNA-methyltransferase PglX [Mycolicibacterium iranicum]ORV89493.1 restriction endonuclease [Mycolicibacterium iranicum]